MAGARQLVEELRRFVASAEAASAAPVGSTTAGGGLSDAGFLLLSLKDQLLASDARADMFVQDLVSRQTSGVDVLVRVIVALQGIVNSSSSASKIGNLLSRNNSSGNRKRKAAVAEADSIECLKILLEKSPNAWRAFLESPTSLEVILYSVNSPQLDSKCYALEIILLLLDQAQGFSILWRALTLLAARSRDYIRLSIFVAQLKHGLHTSKLHIQILVVRLMNKLLGQAPSPNHRLLAQVEAALSQFSPDHLEKLVLDMHSPLGGLDTLLEELAIYRSLCASGYRGSGDGSSGRSTAFGFGDGDSDSSRQRRIQRNTAKFAQGPTTVVKSVERQRQRKAEAGGDSGGRRSSGHTASSSGGSSRAGYYPHHRAAYTLSNTFDLRADDFPSYHGNPPMESGYRGGGGMRRAKSESAMLFDDDISPHGKTRSLARAEPAPAASEYHPLHGAKQLSRSIHDMSQAASEVRRPLSGASSLLGPVRSQSRSLQRTLSPPRARFADPPIMDTPQQPHAGFSYLFPTAPTLATVVPKRPITPDPNSPSGEGGSSVSVSVSNHHLMRPLSAPGYSDGGLSPRSPVPRLSPQRPYESQAATRPTPHRPSEGQVTYIPVNVETSPGGTRIGRPHRYDRSRALSDDESASRSRRGSDPALRSPAGTIGEDVRDALSQFDYLNEYDATGGGSPRPHAPYAGHAVHRY